MHSFFRSSYSSDSEKQSTRKNISSSEQSFKKNYSPNLHSAPSSPTSVTPITSSSDSDSSSSTHSIPCPIPAVTLSDHSAHFVPSLQLISVTNHSHCPTNMSTSSPSPLKFPGFRSRFNKPNNAIKPASSQPNSRPSFIHVSPPPVALFIDPDSWVHSEDSDDDDDEEEEEQELKGESDSLASSNEEGCMENDEMPLSQLLQSRSMNRGEADSTPSRNRHEALAAQPRDPLKFPKVIGSSRPFRSLCPTKDTQRLPPRAAATPVLGVPDQPRVRYQEARNIGCTPLMTSKAPSRDKPKPLRSAMSSPNLSQRIYNNRHDPLPTPHTARPGVTFFPSPILLGHSPNHHLLSPGSQIRASDFPAPPTSISPPTRSPKLSSSQSSVVSNQSSERQDVFRRMRRRHKEEMHCRHHPQSQSLSRLPQSPSTVIPPLIDDSLYSLLNHAQQCALRQRSDILSNNLKCHLEAFAHEMIQANSLNTQQQQHPQDPHSLFSPCGVGAH